MHGHMNVKLRAFYAYVIKHQPMNDVCKNVVVTPVYRNFRHLMCVAGEVHAQTLVCR
jgi:hypothetical protein